MGEKNFMEAGTEIEGMVEKIDQCLTKISNVLAEACVSRGKSGKTNSLETDIMNVIKSLPAEHQVIVLRKVAVLLAKQIGGKPANDNGKSNSSSNSIFANRRF